MLDDDGSLYPPPPPPPDPPHGSGPVLGGAAKLVLAVSLIAGAGVGGFVIAQAATASSPSSVSAPGAFPDAHSGAVQAATTPTATPTPKHNCPNMGGSRSSSGSNSSATTSIFMPRSTAAATSSARRRAH